MPKQILIPLFDSLTYELDRETEPTHLPPMQKKDYEKIREFLLNYRGSEGTYNAYRRDIERFFHWCYLKTKKIFSEIKRQDVEDYLEFCQKPPKSWIGLKHTPRFINVNAQRMPNKKWKPFVVTLSKLNIKKDETPKIEDYQLSQNSLKDIFTTLGGFYNFLIQENYLDKNPILVYWRDGVHGAQSAPKPAPDVAFRNPIY